MANELEFPPEFIQDEEYSVILREEIQDNYLKAEVYFQSLNVKRVVQKEKFTV